VGAILSQKTDKGEEFVCSYGSRLLKGAELHYGITEKECLAVVWAIKHFRVYLYGSKFVVVTDHSALGWLMSICDPTARLARWSIYLQAYEFDIVHRKGKIHSNVDALSRPVLLMDVEIPHVIEDDTEKLLDPWDDSNFLFFLEYRSFPPGCSKKQIKRIKCRS